MWHPGFHGERFIVHGARLPPQLCQSPSALEDGSVVEDTWEDGKKVSSTLLPPKQNNVPKKNLPTSTTKDASGVTKGD